MSKLKAKEDDPWSDLRSEVNELCQEYGTKKFLSHLLGIPPDRVSKILHGPSEPRATVALQLNGWVAGRRSELIDWISKHSTSSKASLACFELFKADNWKDLSTSNLYHLCAKLKKEQECRPAEKQRINSLA